MTEWRPDQQLVDLVTETVEAIAKHNGYAVYPKESDVRQVLKALYIVNKALEVLNESGAGRTEYNAGQSERPAKSPDSNGDKGS